METTIRTDRRRKGAAVALVGLGIATLGLASASHLAVSADSDLVASGVDASIDGFLSDEAAAHVAVTYPDVEAGTEGMALATDDTLPVTVTLDVTDAANEGVEGVAQVFFYAEETLVLSADDVAVTEGETADITEALGITSGEDALPTYDRVAVVVEPAGA